MIVAKYRKNRKDLPEARSIACVGVDRAVREHAATKAG